MVCEEIGTGSNTWWVFNKSELLLPNSLGKARDLNVWYLTLTRSRQAELGSDISFVFDNVLSYEVAAIPCNSLVVILSQALH